MDPAVRAASPTPPLRRHLPRVVDELLAIELAKGTTRVAAAKALGISERTVYHRLQDRDFRARVGELQRESLAAALGKLMAASGDAVDTLHELAMNGEEEKVRLGASQAMLEQTVKIAQAFDWQRKYEELKARLDAVEQEQDPKQIT